MSAAKDLVSLISPLTLAAPFLPLPAQRQSFFLEPRLHPPRIECQPLFSWKKVLLWTPRFPPVLGRLTELLQQHVPNIGASTMSAPIFCGSRNLETNTILAYDYPNCQSGYCPPGCAAGSLGLRVCESHMREMEGESSGPPRHAILISPQRLSPNWILTLSA